jgi:hypothetical protein
MNVIEEHTSPDGFLRLIVVQDDDGDIAIGFDRYPWHTHGDILTAISGVSEMQAIREFVDRIIGDNAVIGVARINGEVREAWVCDNDPAESFKYKPPQKTLEFRRWSGAPVQVESV